MTSGARLPTVTVTVFTPAVLPRVHVPIDVGESEFVDVGAFASVPPPAVTVTVIETPPRIFPFASLTENVGELANTSPAVPDGVVDPAVSEDGTDGSVPPEQPKMAKAIAAAVSGSERILIIRGICNRELKNHR
jgi:hypothetical protein